MNGILHFRFHLSEQYWLADLMQLWWRKWSSCSLLPLLSGWRHFSTDTPEELQPELSCPENINLASKTVLKGTSSGITIPKRCYSSSREENFLPSWNKTFWNFQIKSSKKLFLAVRKKKHILSFYISLCGGQQLLLIIISSCWLLFLDWLVTLLLQLFPGEGRSYYCCGTGREIETSFEGHYLKSNKVIVITTREITKPCKNLEVLLVGHLCLETLYIS